MSNIEIKTLDNKSELISKDKPFRLNLLVFFLLKNVYFKSSRV